MFALFFKAAPWIAAKSIGELPPEIREKYPPPEWARSYSMGHGKPSYFRDHPNDQPLRKYSLIVGLAACLAFLGGSAVWSTAKAKKCSVRDVLTETNLDQGNGGT